MRLFVFVLSCAGAFAFQRFSVRPTHRVHTRQLAEREDYLSKIADTYGQSCDLETGVGCSVSEIRTARATGFYDKSRATRSMSQREVNVYVDRVKKRVDVIAKARVEAEAKAKAEAEAKAKAEEEAKAKAEAEAKAKAEAEAKAKAEAEAKAKAEAEAKAMAEAESKAKAKETESAPVPAPVTIMNDLTKDEVASNTNENADVSIVEQAPADSKKSGNALGLKRVRFVLAVAVAAVVAVCFRA